MFIRAWRDGEGRPFCIDKYEASIEERELGSPTGQDTAAIVRSVQTSPSGEHNMVPGRAGHASIQASRLCTNQEWQSAVAALLTHIPQIQGMIQRNAIYGANQQASRCHLVCYHEAILTGTAPDCKAGTAL